MAGYKDFSELVMTVGEMTGQGDFGNRSARLVGMLETYLNKKVRTSDMEATATLTPDIEGWVNLPSDYVDDRYVTRSKLYFRKMGVPSVVAGYFGYAIKGKKILISPASGDFDLDYYQEIPPIETNPASWLFADTPEIYEAGLMHHAFKYARDAEQALLHKAELDVMIGDLNRADSRGRYGGTRIMLSGPTP